MQNENQMMDSAPTNEPSARKPLRLWPGVVAAVLLALLMFVVPVVIPDGMMIGMFGGVAAGLLILVWWLFFSRAPWSERVGALVLMAVVLFATKRIVHPSIAGAGMGMMLPILGTPVLCLALVLWAVATRRLSSG